MMKLLIRVLAFAATAFSTAAAEYDLGAYGKLSMNHPPSWSGAMRDTREGGKAIVLEPKEGNARCSIVFSFLKNPTPIDRDKLGEAVLRAGDKLVQSSVEKKKVLHDMELTQGYGVYSPFRDAALVGKPSKKGDFKTISVGKFQLNDTVTGTVTILADELDGDDAIVMWHIVRSMALQAAGKQEATGKKQ